MGDFHNDTSGALNSFLQDNILFSDVPYQRQGQIVADSQLSVGDFLKKSVGGPLDSYNPSPIKPFSTLTKRDRD